MKAAITCLFLVGALHAAAQKVNVKNEIVYVDDTEYCRLVKSGMLSPTFSVRNMDGSELIEAKYDNSSNAYDIKFVSSGESCTMSGTLGFGKIFAKELAENSVIANGNINPEGAKQFIARHSGGAQAEPSERNDNTTARITLVERDRSMPVTVRRGELEQDNTKVGFYDINNAATEGMKKINIFCLKGEKVAECILSEVKAGICRIVTLKDKKENFISLSTRDDAGMAREIAEYLSGKFYL